jgi:hypothetical protein
MGGIRSKVEGGDRHDLEPEGTREDTRHEIYTGYKVGYKVGVLVGLHGTSPSRSTREFY